MGVDLHAKWSGVSWDEFAGLYAREAPSRWRDTMHDETATNRVGGVDVPPRGHNRRRFLQASFASLLVPLLNGCTDVVGGALQALRAAATPKKLPQFGGKITLPGTVADYPLDSITPVREGKFYISHVPEGLLALYWKCKHLGCTVPWKPNEEFGGNTGVFHCPCHSSIYLRTGQNAAGPAPAPLDIMEITVAGGKITVDTGKITRRVRYEPSQATKV